MAETVRNTARTLWARFAQLLSDDSDHADPGAREFVIAGEEEARHARARLDRMFRHHDKVTLAKIHFLNLEKLILRRTTDWDATLQTLGGIARDVFREYAGPDDEIHLDENASVTVFFPRLTREAGQLKLAAMADAIVSRARQRQTALSGLQHKTASACIDRRRYVRQVAGADKPLLHAEDLRAEKQRIEAGNRAFAAMNAASSDAGAPREETPFWQRVLRNEEHDIPEDVEVAFSAVWRVKVEMITGRLCRVSVGGRTEDGDDRFRGDITDLRQAQLDSYVLARTVSHVVEMMWANRQVIHIVPISFRSIERDPHRLKTLGVLQSAPEAARRLIVCEIVDLPPNASVRRLQEPLTRVQGLCRSTMAQLPLSTTSLRGWREVGVNTVGVMLPADAAPTRDLVRSLDAFSFKARATSLTPYIWGVETKVAAAASLAADFGYLSGSLLDRLIGDVDNVRTLTLKQLYRAT